jgi:hypothetical protein
VGSAAPWDFRCLSIRKFIRDIALLLVELCLFSIPSLHSFLWLVRGQLCSRQYQSYTSSHAKALMRPTPRGDNCMKNNIICGSTKNAASRPPCPSFSQVHSPISESLSTSVPPKRFSGTRAAVAYACKLTDEMGIAINCAGWRRSG